MIWTKDVQNLLCSTSRANTLTLFRVQNVHIHCRWEYILSQVFLRTYAIELQSYQWDADTHLGAAYKAVASQEQCVKNGSSFWQQTWQQRRHGNFLSKKSSVCAVIKWRNQRMSNLQTYCTFFKALLYSKTIASSSCPKGLFSDLKIHIWLLQQLVRINAVNSI